ncbi:hypothetical protein BSPWISOXPB_11154 [uncultured Gammaproteobacteria bacterium]|nr:hypothetical protein BSPWISOXPB_11154 [uncultured Gammaproteobacteria bacterium]
MEYEQIADGNTEAYFTLTLAEGTVLLNGVKALVAKVVEQKRLNHCQRNGDEYQRCWGFVNDLVRRGLVMLDNYKSNSKKVIANSNPKTPVVAEENDIIFIKSPKHKEKIINGTKYVDMLLIECKKEV